MITYAARRLLSCLPLLWIILTLVFLLVEAVPGDPFSLEPGPAVSRGSAAAMNEAFGTGRSFGIRYVEWLGRFVRGDLGVSYSLRRPVLGLVAESAWNTCRLASLALVLQFVVCLAAGLAAVARRGSWVDRAIVAASSFLYAIPSYWLALVLIWIFSVRLGWLPASQMSSLEAASWGGPERFFDAARHLLLPCLSMTLPAAAGLTLYVRETLADVMTRGFIRTARSRGAGDGRILVRHGLSGAMLPLLNLLGMALPGLVGGSAVIEVVHAWPGMGRLAYQSVLAHDQPLILGCVWAAAMLVLAGSLLADLTSAMLDPRVRESTG